MATFKDRASMRAKGASNKLNETHLSADSVFAPEKTQRSESSFLRAHEPQTGRTPSQRILRSRHSWQASLTFCRLAFRSPDSGMYSEGRGWFCICISMFNRAYYWDDRGISATFLLGDEEWGTLGRGVERHLANMTAHGWCFHAKGLPSSGPTPRCDL